MVELAGGQARLSFGNCWGRPDRFGVVRPRSDRAVTSRTDARHTLVVPRLSYRRLDQVRGVRGGLVTPHPDHSPAGGSQTCIGIPIACAVGLQLCLPPGPVATRQRSVNGTTMPVTAVDKHCDLVARKNDVGSPSGAIEHLPVNTKAHSAAVELRPQHELRASVTPQLGSHPSPRRDG